MLGPSRLHEWREEHMSLLGGLDWAVIAAYFALVFGVAIWATRRERANKNSSADYFLAGRDAGWFLVGGSLFASNICLLYTSDAADE